MTTLERVARAVGNEYARQQTPNISSLVPVVTLTDISKAALTEAKAIVDELGQEQASVFLSAILEDGE